MSLSPAIIIGGGVIAFSTTYHLAKRTDNRSHKTHSPCSLRFLISCAASCHLFGAAVVIVGDLNKRSPQTLGELRLRNRRTNRKCQTITLNEAPKGYKDFDKGAANKFVIDPHGMIAA